MQLLQEKRYTYADYITWDEKIRYELIDGIPYAMVPASGRVHQEISGELFRQLANYLKDKPCKAFAAPFDVRLNANEDDDTVVQPDITVVCNKSKLDDRGCVGVPDMVIEIQSPSSARRDRTIKFHTYLRVGIREYWIVDPDTKSVQVHLLKDS